MARGNGDARLAIFGRKVTPNQHALADQFVLLDNLYCDGEVSEDGHSWSNAAYATDANEKQWPVTYGGHSECGRNPAYVPSAGNIWDRGQRKGLTYRSYGECGQRASAMRPVRSIAEAPRPGRARRPNYKRFGGARYRKRRGVHSRVRSIREKLRQPDPEKRLPNFMVMALSENHTNGTRPGSFTPVAMVASNDLAWARSSSESATAATGPKRRFSSLKTTRRMVRITWTRTGPRV